MSQLNTRLKEAFQLMIAVSHLELANDDRVKRSTKSVIENRVKRLWFVLGGTFLNTVLGTPTESQVGELRDEMQNEINWSKVAVKTLDVKLNSVTHTIDAVVTQLSMVTNEIDKNSDRLTELDHFISINRLINSLETAVNCLITLALD